MNYSEPDYLADRRKRSEETIKKKSSDFTAKYYAVYDLLSLSETDPGMIMPETVHTLEGLMKIPEYSRMRQGFFLFRHTAEALSSFIVNCKGDPVARLAYTALTNILGSTTGFAHRTAAEALGSLPFSLCGPECEEMNVKRTPSVRLQELTGQNNVGSSFVLTGRSLVFETSQGLFVVKIARPGDSPMDLLRESFWMDHIRGYEFPGRFDIPKAVRVKDSYVFRLKKPLSFQIKIHPESYAIAFTVDRDYFTYPNGNGINGQPGKNRFREMMSRNSMILGRLSSYGIVHSALIPLFHNRVQVERRRDQGLYEWFRAGRLDRWLDSCAFPNLGATGIRDFEHFIAFKGSNRQLYRHIGSHFLSLLLILGSYFRNKDRQKTGIDKNGDPVDVRGLFDELFLKEMII